MAPPKHRETSAPSPVLGQDDGRGDGPTQLIYQGRDALLVLRAAAVRVTAGPDAGAGCPLATARVRIGSAGDNDLVLTDLGVSRHHLELQVHDRGYLARDLDSTNGTFYRGARVREVLLGPAAELRLGASVLRIEPGEERSDRIAGRGAFGGLIGTSPAMQKVYGVLAAVAPTDTTVLLTGETGTGKEVVAEALHGASPRAGKLLSVIDCGALPGGLIESELFGHERGAFTGADTERPGIFERTRGGTVFLDEIGELPLALQTRLLRVLDRRTIRRVGGDAQRPVDVRLVAATNRRLEQAVEQGGFRRDLYYRLSVVRVKLPPLRRRTEDIPALARHFLIQAGAPDPAAVLTPKLVDVLVNRRWPGNVRELRNVIERAMLMADGTEPSETSLRSLGSAPPALPAPQPAPLANADAAPGWLASAMPARLCDTPYREARDSVLEEFDKLYLGRLVDRHQSNISAIARDAGLDRHVVRRLLRKHGLYR